MSVKLGINIDHVATLREARGGVFPSIKEAAIEAEKGGADGITVHLREDRRHIQDRDVFLLKRIIRVPLNLEMSIASEISDVALKICPEKVCLVPEKRKELTTEGGLDLFSKRKALKATIKKLKKKKIEISLFIDPEEKQIKEAARLGVYAIEIHTGSYANSHATKKKKELKRIGNAAKLGNLLGLKIHAGHGLDYENVRPVFKIPEIKELNIGHSIISRAVFIGLRKAVLEMKEIIKK